MAGISSTPNGIPQLEDTDFRIVFQRGLKEDTKDLTIPALEVWKGRRLPSAPKEKGVQTHISTALSREWSDEEIPTGRFSSDMTLEDIRASHSHFCKERNWGKFHTPRNILLAMVGEVGELSEIFQWKGEVQEGLPDFQEEEKNHVGEEISDILIYLVDLAAKCHIDLPAALHSKMQKNAKKYPVNGSIQNFSTAAGSTQNFSLYGDQRNLVGSSVPEREREEGDGSE